MTALLVVVLLVSVPTAPVTGPPAARGGDPYVHGGTSGHGKAVGTPAGSGSISAGPAFFRNVTSNSSNFYTQGNAPCFAPSAAIGASCDPWASNPNLLHLSNGGTGLVYAVGTTDSSVVCHGLPEGNTSSRLVFTESPASGQSWAGGTLLGQTASTCPYYQALEPAFTTNSSGGIVGVYVGANATFESMSFVSGVQGQVLNANYSNRSSDALIFTSSSDDGSTFSDGTILRAAGHHVARPAIATFGNSIYVLFENISNSTSLAPNVLPALAPPAGVASNTAISVWFMASTDGGSTWTSPEEMPGENATEFNNSMSPSISISASGEIAVAYLTDRACLAYCGSLTAGLEHYGDDLVVLTSTSNGSTWSSIRTVFSGIGEPSYGNADRLYGSSGSLFFVFQYAPAPVLVWNTTGSQIYVAWSGSYNISSPGTLFYSGMYGDVDYSFPAIYVGTSTNGGSSWSVSRLTSVGNFTILGGYFAASLPTYDLDPGLAVSDGHVFVTYLEVNQTNAMSLSNCGYYGGSTYDSSLSQWLVESPNARDWSRTSLLAFQDGTNAPNAYLGPLSSMLAWNGTPTVAFPFPTGYRYLPWYGETADVEVATPYQGPTENVSFQPLSTLSSGAQEYIGVDGAPFAVGKSGLTLTGVPQDQWIVVNVSTGGVVPAGDTPLPEGQGVFLIEGNTTLTVGSQLFTGLNLTLVPNPGYFGWRWINSTFSMNAYADFEEYWSFLYRNWTTSWYGSCPYALIPVGIPVSLGYDSSTASIEYWDGSTSWAAGSFFGVAPTYAVGSGGGSYTGWGANFTINASGPVNETLYLFSSGEYSEEVAAPTLPTGTPFQFRWDGDLEGSTTGAPVTLQNVSSGYHPIDDITATSPTAGWIYAGSSDAGDPVDVPQSPTVNLSFAFLNESAPPGNVSFVATQLPAGTTWQLSFNGTVYASSSRWINVTAHPGTYPVAGFPVISVGGDAGYVPSDVGPQVSVAVGGQYPVNFTPAYEVQAFASEGGTVSALGPEWVAAGTPLAATAAPANGWGWVGWAGTGNGSYTGPNLTANLTVEGPILEVANFAPLPVNRSTLVITEAGIPVGTPWTIDLDGRGYSSSSATLVIPDLAGCATSTVQRLYVPDENAGSGTNLTRYVATAYPTSFCVGSSPVVVDFATQFALSVTATAGGTGTVANGSNEVEGTVWRTSGSTADLSATPDAGYQFDGWVGSGPGNFTGPEPIAQVTVGSPITEIATFSPVPPPPASPRFTETFTEATVLAPGTVWGVSLGAGRNFSSSGTTLTASGLAPGTYTVTVPTVHAPGGQIEYVPSPATFSLTVAANGTRAISLTTDFWVAIDASGPGTVSPGPGWRMAGTSFLVSSAPMAGEDLLDWTGSGPGSYNGSASNFNLTVRGPVVETAVFGSPEPGAPATTSSGFWGTPSAWALLAVAAAVLGVAAGVIIGRRGRADPGTPPETPDDLPPEQGPPEASTPEEPEGP